MKDDKGFWLYDLKVEVILENRNSICRHIEGEHFSVQGENLIFTSDQRISMYALAAILPLLPAKQRMTSDYDWMSTDAEVACPDPHCGGRFRISRKAKRWFSHEETTGLPQHRGTPYWKKEEDL
tara:strand:- start:33 stop:404 length:372 start_codon:yes stop_codon:yes gene_type:complete